MTRDIIIGYNNVPTVIGISHILCTHQRYGISGFFQSFDGGSVGYVDDGCVVHFNDNIVDFEPAIGGGRATGYQLGDINICVIADVRIISAAGDTEP